MLLTQPRQGRSRTHRQGRQAVHVRNRRFQRQLRQIHRHGQRPPKMPIVCRPAAVQPIHGLNAVAPGVGQRHLGRQKIGLLNLALAEKDLHIPGMRFEAPNRALGQFDVALGAEDRHIDFGHPHLQVHQGVFGIQGQGGPIGFGGRYHVFDPPARV